MACSSNWVSARWSNTISGLRASHPSLCISSLNSAANCCARFFCSHLNAVVRTFEQPGTRIPAPEAAKVSKRLQACLLNHIFCIVAAPHEPAREVVSRIEMRKDDLVKTANLCVHQMFVVHAANLRSWGSGLNGLPILDRWDPPPRVTD